jgi:hypothetical protein
VSLSPSVLRVCMPAALVAVVCLFLLHLPLLYWLFALLLLPIVVFMVTLAEVRDEGHQVLVKMLWNSARIAKEDILKTSDSLLEGIGVLRLRRYVFPWGGIYFVREWSTRTIAENRSFWLDLLASGALAISGFVAARATHMRGISFESSHSRILALVTAGGLCLLFLLTRKKQPSFANSALFAAAFILGLVQQ